jgi:hypothetical protein
MEIFFPTTLLNVSAGEREWVQWLAWAVSWSRSRLSNISLRHSTKLRINSESKVGSSGLRMASPPRSIICDWLTLEFPLGDFYAPR